ncbi:RimJ/RimL family protein N-acetyltransferase [Nocardioides luteus]|uniref:Succinyl-CoA transferase n=1 Tax=Nocardioides luteus TaxID=1844 RepID=A0ABQ5T3C5_9ACTN|nr:GNAT family N-acetyltransferase [Nocardioides luteus]MDR7310204.1 RimJ/RimL family protein N-acetyltransferase [Nocardioides luteus]GGR69541.1 succinyl-CoA transferase Rv0802c [Nocardioides luteus]GLJ70328.1 putative succinyl-CoA transferase [Nocardioides luteus]
MTLTEVWPIFGLVIRTPRLALRLPTDAELAQLAQVAADGVHEPTQRPFLTPWTEQPPLERARHVMQGAWGSRGDWTPDDWSLGLTVFHDGRPIGVVWVSATEFGRRREVSTTSWLGLPHHRHGFGTEARLGALTLVFDHLGGTYATSEAFPDNAASVGVSSRLGYEPDGISRDVRDGEVLISQRLRLSRDRWELNDRSSVTVSGVEPCLPLFGV